MSKVEELKQKYPRVSQVTAQKFINMDTTPTKKYLEYMFKMWTRKLDRLVSIPSAEALITEVKLYDSLLPHNTDYKDIYHKDFWSYNFLKNLNLKCQEIKQDKNFNREDHIKVVYEDDEVLMLEPITHKGSLKYGSNTKWCTASRSAESTFRNYVNRGCLVYLIDKTESKGNQYNKLAFYCHKSNSLLERVEVYNQLDNNVEELNIINGKWDSSKFNELVLRYRLYHAQWSTIKKSRDNVKSTVEIMKDLDLMSFMKDVQFLNNIKTETKLSDEAKSILNLFMEKVIKLEGV